MDLTLIASNVGMRRENMLTYNEAGQAFWNGKRIPRTTEVCKLLAPRGWEVDEYYLRKGRIVHLILEWEDSGELDESTVDPNLKGYLQGYRKFKIDTGWVPLYRETKFYSLKYGFCGRADAVGSFLKKRWIWCLDFKTGQPHESDLYQAPAYLFGLNGHLIKPQRCGDLYLQANGTYRLVEVKNPTDKFLKFLTGIKKWREEQNGSGDGKRE